MKKILLIALVALSFAACKKIEDKIEPEQPAPIVDKVATSEKQLVDSVIIVKQEGTFVITYKYDNNNKITNMHESTFSPPGLDADIDHVYTYDTQGNLIKSVITKGGNISTFTYTYQNGEPTLVSYSEAANPTKAYTIDVTVQNNQVTGNIIHKYSGESTEVSYLYKNGNKIIENTNSYSLAGVKTTFATFNGVYGISKNPYLYSGNKWVLPDVPFANKNDVYKTSTSKDDSEFTMSTIRRNYNAQNYPILALEQIILNDKISSFYTFYKYINAK
ncbi:MAG: hypothetical protein V4456_17775 [Bacteroidota bacterium]